ncbi:putative 2'-deoxynucleoside 5'-phosphate N-hydrolase 1 [Saccostrea echinata]|uniref:putative 2'-deoxynucleoside 5'-phosphate N-hydrolase 1 n=1 Tax=Saccostrea echinata TaxID=191078 RepID=UPI002A7F89F5|nr:putative 2'-deoxynucleoside 5'-phosphate N-hydrolase 1 [Saccostrea echinata]
MSMLHKIYFAGSITGGRQDADLYLRLVNHLKKCGTVLTEHVASSTVEADEEAEGLTDILIHDRDIDWLSQCDVLVAEVTQASTGVGYEIGRAVAMNKTIICLFRPEPEKRISPMISGAKGDNFYVYHYTEDQVPEILSRHFS